MKAEGVASDFIAVGQHSDRFGLAYFNMRDSWKAFAYMGY